VLLNWHRGIIYHNNASIKIRIFAYLELGETMEDALCRAGSTSVQMQQKLKAAERRTLIRWREKDPD
jgi:hypothetical protein